MALGAEQRGDGGTAAGLGGRVGARAGGAAGRARTPGAASTLAGAPPKTVHPRVPQRVAIQNFEKRTLADQHPDGKGGMEAFLSQAAAPRRHLRRSFPLTSFEAIGLSQRTASMSFAPQLSIGCLGPVIYNVLIILARVTAAGSLSLTLDNYPRAFLECLFSDSLCTIMLPRIKTRSIRLPPSYKLHLSGAQNGRGSF